MTGIELIAQALADAHLHPVWVVIPRYGPAVVALNASQIPAGFQQLIKILPSRGYRSSWSPDPDMLTR